MDVVTELVAVVGISVAAHVSIAWAAIAYHARRAELKWDRKVNEEMIPRAAKEAASTLRAILAEPDVFENVSLPNADLGPSLEGWLRSPSGVAWAQELATLASREVVAGLKSQLSSAAGVVAREGQSAAQKILAGAISFDNPMLDGLWAMVPPSEKRMVVGKLYKLFRNGGVEAPEDAPAPSGAPQIQGFGGYLL